MQWSHFTSVRLGISRENNQIKGSQQHVTFNSHFHMIWFQLVYEKDTIPVQYEPSNKYMILLWLKLVILRFWSHILF